MKIRFLNKTKTFEWKQSFRMKAKFLNGITFFESITKLKQNNIESLNEYMSSE